MKTKYGQKAKLYYMVCLKTEDIYLEIAKDIEIRFDTSNHEI